MFNASIFINIRIAVLTFVFVCAGVVLGISAKQADLFLPKDSDFIIFALVVSGSSIVWVFTVLLRSTPFMETFLLFAFGILWLSLAAFSVDHIGGIQCINLADQTLPTRRNGTVSSEQHCRELKVIMAFSWAEFATSLLMFIIVVSLTIRARTHGAESAVWNESISDLPWFGNWVSENGGHYPTQRVPYHPYAAQSFPGSMGTPGRMVIQAPPPGESVVIRPGDFGHPMPGYPMPP